MTEQEKDEERLKQIENSLLALRIIRKVFDEEVDAYGGFASEFYDVVDEIKGHFEELQKVYVNYLKEAEK